MWLRVGYHRFLVFSFIVSPSTGGGAQEGRGIAEEDGRAPRGDAKGGGVDNDVSVAIREATKTGFPENHTLLACPPSSDSWTGSESTTAAAVQGYSVLFPNAMMLSLLLRGAAAATPDASSISAPGNPSRLGGRRASRWGVSAVAPIPAAEPMPADEVSSSAANTANAAPPTTPVVSEVQIRWSTIGITNWVDVHHVQDVCESSDARTLCFYRFFPY